jgi:hypothetical protein
MKGNSNVKRLINDGNAELIEHLSELYEAGEVKGIIIGVSLNNGEFITMDSGTLAYLESLGLATSIIHGLQYGLEESD